MNKYELTKRIENFAPLETQEKWDCSGWIVDAPNHDEISKVMLCLTVTDDVVKQAQANNCDMIISHHPLFFVPFSYLSKDSSCHSEAENFRDPSLTLRMTTAEESHKISFINNKTINIYCAHTNLDLAQGGTTDVLIENVIKAARQLGSQVAKLEEQRAGGQEVKLIEAARQLRSEAAKFDINDIPQKSTCHCEEDESPTWQSIVPNNEKLDCFANARNDSLSETSQTQQTDNDLFAYSPIRLFTNNLPTFLRYIQTEISINDFLTILKQISPHLRYVNNKNIQTLQKIAFCAGSGADFIEEAHQNGADALVTGDLKFHTALDSPIVLFDIGHFESEIGVLKVFENLINNDVEVIYAQEKSPFNY